MLLWRFDFLGAAKANLALRLFRPLGGPHKVPNRRDDRWCPSHGRNRAPAKFRWRPASDTRERATEGPGQGPSLSSRHPIYDQLPMARSQLSSLPLPLPHLTIHPSRTGRHHRGPTDPKLAPGGSPFWNCDAPPAQQMTRATLPTPSISGPAIRR